MRVGIITDTHFGIRGDSTIMLSEMTNFLKNQFFPHLKREGISVIIHCGDLVDVRKSINFNTATSLKKEFLDVCHANNFKVHFVVGNHDTFYKTTNELNVYKSLQLESYGDTFTVYDVPKEVYILGNKVLFLPWICKDNKEESERAIQNSSANYVFSHLELSGCLFHKGVEAKSGEDPKIYSKFEYVFSGHYHTRSTTGNIHYLGAPCEYTWIDSGDCKGFHIFDFSTRDLTFIANKKKLYRKFDYDDKKNSFDSIMAIDFASYKDTFVKILVHNKNDPKCLDWVVDTLEKSGAYKVTVVEDKFVVDNTETEVSLEVQDTFSLLSKYVDELEVSNKDIVRENLIELYQRVGAVD